MPTNGVGLNCKADSALVTQRRLNVLFLPDAQFVYTSCAGKPLAQASWNSRIAGEDAVQVWPFLARSFAAWWAACRPPLLRHWCLEQAGSGPGIPFPVCNFSPLLVGGQLSLVLSWPTSCCFVRVGGRLVEEGVRCCYPLLPASSAPVCFLPSCRSRDVQVESCFCLELTKCP